ncbi:MAG: SUMF1/EgtB/PvdO family nonheme iron enzyme, partial [Treponema sp.]|nr:SUMF1/EgtB/PvdO family nonheme iron enzyme [Treponema sp.]
MKRSVFSSIVLAASILLLLVSCKKKEEKKKDNTPEGFVRISAGTFKMGSKAGDKFEKPAHQVKLTHDIYMSDHELTQAEYKAYCIFGSSQPSE